VWIISQSPKRARFLFGEINYYTGNQSRVFFSSSLMRAATFFQTYDMRDEMMRAAVKHTHCLRFDCVEARGALVGRGAENNAQAL